MKMIKLNLLFEFLLMIIIMKKTLIFIMIFPKKENSLIKKEHDKVDVLSSDKLRNSIMDSFNDKSKKKNKIIYPKKTKKKK